MIPLQVHWNSGGDRSERWEVSHPSVCSWEVVLDVESMIELNMFFPRAQELLLILDEYWAAHPDLVDIPIYYASSLAKKCMAVYQTFINSMNERIRRQIAVNNPFVFKHISNLKGIDHFDDIGPCVILASPGMMQSGLSR